jgi:glutamate racemase
MAKIGIFDSGYGGLTILDAIRKELPQYDYLYLGDNARAPYGTHSFDVIYRYTLQAVQYLLDNDCALVILACNTASAKALRTIQQKNLPLIKDKKVNVLGVIRPTVEAVPAITKTGHVGILATPATVSSESYVLELEKIAPELAISQQACPMWVPLVENFEFDSPGADYFVELRINQLLKRDPDIDTIILACTHYPLLLPKIRHYSPADVTIISQGVYVAQSINAYLANHADMAQRITKNGTLRCLTTENPNKFCATANRFLGHEVKAENIVLS